METLTCLMAMEANKVGMPSYVGDLIHDAATIKDAEAGDVYYWIFKSNDCGTWMVHKDSDYLVTHLATGAKLVYELTIVETGEGWDYPKGYVRKREFRLEPSESNKAPTVVFT